MRDSPAITVAQTLTYCGMEAATFDPKGMDLPKPMMPELTMCDSRTWRSKALTQ